MKVHVGYLEQNLQQGIIELERYGFLEVGADGIAVSAKQGESISIEKSEHAIKIVYDTEPHFYMVLARAIAVTEGTYAIQPRIKKFGIMWDCSRNAVPKIETVKRQICSMVLAGYNYLELYTEDTYELPGEPYFGYKRGRYSQEELREIVAFADVFKLEMVPCIQVLAHLKNLANWKPYYDHMDIDDILLVDDERTYALIRKMLMFCKETFHTDRINIGSDEAFHLGRGKYTDEYGYCPKDEVYLKHMKKVFAMCKELGLKPEFWADAFYDTKLSTEKVKAFFDDEQTPIYWDYYSSEQEFHIEKMKKLKEYAGKVSYAGGLWTWIGYAPDNAFSDKITDAAFEAAWECGVKDILMTAWGDNGGECSIFTVIPSMWYAASKIYPIDVDYEKIIEELTGYTETEWRLCDALNTVTPQADRMSNSVKYLLSNDYLVGLLDANIPDCAGKRYAELYPQFRALAKKKSPYAYIFKVYAAMCKVLVKKATYSKRLYETYQKKDMGCIAAMLVELREIQTDAIQMYDAFRAYWMRENKGFGFEVIDVRIGGGLIARIDTVAKVLNDYIGGKIDKIDELEEERIEYFCGQLTGEDVYAPLHNCWATAYTVNHI